MGLASLDLSKIPASTLQELEAAGAISIPAVAPSSAAVPTSVTSGGASPAALPAASVTVTGTQPTAPSTASKINTAFQEIASILSTGVAGPDVAKGAQVAEVAEGLGAMVFELFNPHTGKTSTHGSAADAVNAGILEMHQKQAHAVAQGASNVGFTVTPKLQVTAADVSKLPTPVLPPKSTNPNLAN